MQEVLGGVMDGLGEGGLGGWKERLSGGEALAPPPTLAPPSLPP